jgi:hypothetical protein
VLPDFPNSKQKVLEGIFRRVSELELHLHPILARVGRYTQHEGTVIEFEQTGYGAKSQNAQEYSVAVEVRFEEVPNLVGAALDAKLRSIANEIGGRKVETMMRRIGEATELTGNQIDAKGEKLSATLILDMIEKAEGSFDKFGKSQSSFLIHPSGLSQRVRYCGCDG